MGGNERELRTKLILRNVLYCVAFIHGWSLPSPMTAKHGHTSGDCIVLRRGKSRE